jgi:hypothetical protein
VEVGVGVGVEVGVAPGIGKGSVAILIQICHIILFRLNCC